MRRAAGIAICFLAGCGLFPELEYLSTCQDGCPGATSTAAGSGNAAANAGAAGAGASAGGAGKSGNPASSGSAGAPVVGGAAGMSGAAAGGSGGAAGGAAGNVGGMAAGGASGASAGAGGSVVGGAGGATAGQGGTSGGGGSSLAGSGGSAGKAGSSAGQSGGAGAAGSPTGGAGGNGGSATAGSAGAGGGAVACPSGRGPTMVRLPKALGGGCVDSTEVTFAQYQAFLDDGEVDPTDQPPECALNTVVTAFNPTQYIYNTYTKEPAKYGPYAVSGVDWCDARAFCAWSGKKLCGKVGGGALPPAQRSTATDAWWLACATQTAKTYPYGGVYDPARCHTEDKDDELIRQSPSMSTCEGGVPGVYDMSGNMLEWTDSCAAGTAGKPETDLCSVRGGSYNYDASSVKCTYSQTAERVRPVQNGVNDGNGLYYTVFGFRCCSE